MPAPEVSLSVQEREPENPHWEEEPPAEADRYGDRPDPAQWHRWTPSDARRLASVEQKLDLLLDYNRHIRRQLAVLSEAARDTRRATADVRTVADSINDAVTLTAERLVNLPTAGSGGAGDGSDTEQMVNLPTSDSGGAGDGSDVELISAASRTAAEGRQARRNRPELSSVGKTAASGTGPAGFGSGPRGRDGVKHSTEHHEEPLSVCESAAGGDATVSRPSAQAPAQEVLHSAPTSCTPRGSQAQRNAPRRGSLRDGNSAMNHAASKVLPGHSRTPVKPVRAAASWKFHDVTPKVVTGDAAVDIQEIPAQDAAPGRYDTACNEAQSSLDERALAEIGVRFWRLQWVAPGNDTGDAAEAAPDSGGAQRSRGSEAAEYAGNRQPSGSCRPGGHTWLLLPPPGGCCGVLSVPQRRAEAGGGAAGTVTQRLRQCRRDSLLSGADAGGDAQRTSAELLSAARQTHQSAAPAGLEVSEGPGMLNAVIDWDSDTEPPNELPDVSNGSFSQESGIPGDPLELSCVERAAALREPLILDDVKVELDDT